MIPVVAGSNPVRHPSRFRRTAAGPAKAQPIALASQSTVEAAFRAVVRAGLRQIEANTRGVIDSRDAEFVHQMRVGMRRFGSAFDAFRAAIPARASARIRRPLRAASRALGDARDWDVLSERLAAAADKRFSERASLDALLVHAAAERTAARRRLRRIIDGDSFEAAVRRAGRWLDTARWRERASPEKLGKPATALAQHALHRLLRKALKSGASAAALSGDERHRLRIRIKRLRYACEFFASLFPQRQLRPFVKRLQRLQDALGELNDLAVAERLLARAAARDATLRRAVVRLHARHARREQRLLIELDARWKRLTAADPFW